MTEKKAGWYFQPSPTHHILAHYWSGVRGKMALCKTFPQIVQRWNAAEHVGLVRLCEACKKEVVR